jgi:hypothetical protein
MNNLPELILYKFLFNIEFLENTRLPEFYGSTFRGAFGWELKKSTDGIYPVYKNIFETEGGENSPEFLKGVKKIPHPFILHTPFNTKTNFVKGEMAVIGMTLVGYTHNFLPSIIEAFSLMGKDGITFNRNKFKLLNVINEDISGSRQLIYESLTNEFIKKYKPITLKDILSGIDYDVKKVRLKFEAPFLIQVNSKEIMEKDKMKILPAVLVGTIERRYKALSRFFCREGSENRELFRPDSSVTINNADIKNYYLLRYSNRSKTKQTFIGLCGSIILEGNLKSILPVLYIGEKINLGKKTSFSWGQYKIEIL